MIVSIYIVPSGKIVQPSCKQAKNIHFDRKLGEDVTGSGGREGGRAGGVSGGGDNINCSSLNMINTIDVSQARAYVTNL